MFSIIKLHHIKSIKCSFVVMTQEDRLLGHPLGLRGAATPACKFGAVSFGVLLLKRKGVCSLAERGHSPVG